MADLMSYCSKYETDAFLELQSHLGLSHSAAESGSKLFTQDTDREYLMAEFDIDASTQRMDSTLVEANIKELSRMDLLGKVVHTFLNDLPDAWYYVDEHVVWRSGKHDIDPRDGELLECRDSG